MLESSFSKILRDDVYFHLRKPEKIKNGIVKRKARLPHVELVRDSPNSGKKPYDFYFAHYKSFYALELKVAKGQSIKMDCVSPHQVEGLYSVEHCGPVGNGYVVIFMENFEDGKQSLVVPIFYWTKITKANKDKTSLKINEILEKYYMYVKVMKRCKVDNHLHWDVIDGIINFERE